jgi:hypothetical protein
MEACLSHDKHEKAVSLVNCNLAQYSVTHRCLEMTVGFMTLPTTVVLRSRPCLRRPYDAFVVNLQANHNRVSSEIKKEHCGRKMFIPQWNGI